MILDWAIFIIMEEEIWKDVVGYEGLYEVSNFGRVKSLNRTVGKNNGRTQTMPEIILKQAEDRYGYYFVNISRNGIQTKNKVHQLVACSFLNHIPSGYKYVVNHIDGNPKNNFVSNLEIVTHRENCSVCFRKNSHSFSSKYVGVSWNKPNKKWMSSILINGIRKNLGRFRTEEDASAAYQKALKDLNANEI